MFMLPLGEDVNNGVEGTSDSKPIRLEGVQKAVFAAFLELLVPLYVILVDFLPPNRG